MLINRWHLFVTEKEPAPNEFSTVNALKRADADGLLLETEIPAIFEDVLYKNGVEKAPYFSTNCWDYQKYENYHQFYFTYFDCDLYKPVLILNGVDTVSEVFINGKKIGETNNMFIPFSFALKNVKKKNNELLIHILPSVTEGKKYPPVVKTLDYNQESMNVRKSPYSFGWDIFPRFTLGGIWKDVVIKEYKPEIEDVRISSDFNNDGVYLKFFVTVNGTIPDGKISVKGVCKDSVFSFQSAFNGNKAELGGFIQKPLFWNVRGYGEQNLYSVSVSVSYDCKVIEKTVRYGIRKIKLLSSETVCDGGKFEFILNDKKVFVLGANWVPTDALYHFDEEKTKKALEAAVDLNCNLLRCWGGGVYESDEFYDLCDEYGLIVWQDFMMACATYPQSKKFLKNIKAEAEYQIKRLRNHPSVCLFCGDNECDNAARDWNPFHLDPNENVITRKIIASAVKRLSDQPYLPSSPYLSPKFIKKSKKTQTFLAEDHLWGARDYFKNPFYATNETYFASEIGYQGCPSPESLKKFMKSVYPIFKDDGNPTKEYLCHATSVKDDYSSPYAYRIRLMAEQVKTLFGETFDNVEDFSKASRISQAEALKFFIESFRTRRNRNGGIIWWNLLDGWPQVSDAVIDYYFEKKLAYFYIKTAQRPLSLIMNEVCGKVVLFGVNDYGEKKNVKYRITDLYADFCVCEGEATIDAFTAKEIKELNVSKDDKVFYLIEWESDGINYKNHFHTAIKNIDYKKYLTAMKKVGYEFKED